MKKILTFLFSLLLFSSFAQDSLIMHYTQTITIDDIKAHMEILASDKFQGRETGEEGQKLAAKYIGKEFEENMLSGPYAKAVSPYFQEFDLARSSWDKVTITIDDITLEYGKDFIIYGSLPVGDYDIDLIYAGYGIETDEYTDYKKIDVKDKYAVVFTDEPINEEGIYYLSESEENSRASRYWTKMSTARSKGAKGMVMISASDEDFNDMIERYGDYLNRPRLGFDNTKSRSSSFGSIYLSNTAGAQLMGVAPSHLVKLKKKINKKFKSNAGKLKASATVEAKKKKDLIGTENVVGVIKGKTYPEQVIVLTAHYDHIGANGEKIYNGADDNASGTIGIMEIAEAFAIAAKEGNGPDRTLVFAAVTGEEKGLLGSKYYTENPLHSLDSTVVNFNLDMIGRSDSARGDNPVYVGGSVYLSEDLFELNKSISELYTPDLIFDMKYSGDRVRGGSDHYHFAKNNVPAVFYFTGIHEDYHRETDTIEKINFEKMEVICRMVFATVWEVANSSKSFR